MSGKVRILSACLLSVCCGACSIGEKQYSCPGRPEGVHCMTTTEVYTATENTDSVAPTALHALGDNPQNLQATSKHRGRGGDPGDDPSSADARAPSVSPMRPGSGGAPVESGLTPTVSIRGGSPELTPIRTPAKVMRAWIAPWQDVHGILHGDSDHFIEIEARRWSLGEPDSSSEPVRFFAVQKVDPTETVGKGPPASTARVGMSERSKQATSSTLPTSGASSWSNSTGGAASPQ
jgi:conjugal transfer pilus assembly protein TraV